MAEKRELTHEEKVRNFKNRFSGRKKSLNKSSAPRDGQKKTSVPERAFARNDK